MAERYFWEYVNLFHGSWKQGADMRMEGLIAAMVGADWPSDLQASVGNGGTLGHNDSS